MSTKVILSSQINDNQPKIIDGRWWVYDGEEYVDSGIAATGQMTYFVWSIVLSKDNWNDNEQSVSHEGFTLIDNYDYSPIYTPGEQWKLAGASGVQLIEVYEGGCRFSCEKVPEKDLIVNIKRGKVIEYSDNPLENPALTIEEHNKDNNSHQDIRELINESSKSGLEIYNYTIEGKQIFETYAPPCSSFILTKNMFVGHIGDIIYVSKNGKQWYSYISNLPSSITNSIYTINDRYFVLPSYSSDASSTGYVSDDLINWETYNFPASGYNRSLNSGNKILSYIYTSASSGTQIFYGYYSTNGKNWSSYGSGMRYLTKIDYTEALGYFYFCYNYVSSSEQYYQIRYSKNLKDWVTKKFTDFCPTLGSLQLSKVFEYNNKTYCCLGDKVYNTSNLVDWEEVLLPKGVNSSGFSIYNGIFAIQSANYSYYSLNEGADWIAVDSFQSKIAGTINDNQSNKYLCKINGKNYIYIKNYPVKILKSKNENVTNEVQEALQDLVFTNNFGEEVNTAQLEIQGFLLSLAADQEERICNLELGIN